MLKRALRRIEPEAGRQRGQYAYLWHRRIGLCTALLVAVLAVTGVLLMHAPQLTLHERKVTADWLLDWYGMAPDTAPISYQTETVWLTWLEGRLYLDGYPVADRVGKLNGAVAAGALIAVASGEELLLFTGEGDLIERVGRPALPGEIQALGSSAAGRLVLRTSDGLFEADADVVAWQSGGVEVRWPQPRKAPDDITTRVMAAYRGDGLPWSRVLLDLHTGRIMGDWGPYLMDAAALCLLLLAGSGIYNWIRIRNRNARSRRRSS